jgi:hypothetical protein
VALGVGVVLLLTADHPQPAQSALQRLPLVRPFGGRGALVSVSF